MVVVWGFGFVHRGERDVKKEGGGGEEERKKLEKGEIILGYIFYCVNILF